MLSLSAISQTLPAQSILQRAEMTSPTSLPMQTPGVDPTSPLDQPTEILPSQPAADSFGSLLGRMVEEVNSKQNAATDAVQSLQSGGNVSLHQAVIAMEEASVSFQLMVEVRNKLLDSYQEVMRMQI
jgi:flagellar hook-basal body complex protein FliE